MVDLTRVCAGMAVLLQLELVHNNSELVFSRVHQMFFLYHHQLLRSYKPGYLLTGPTCEQDPETAPGCTLYVAKYCFLMDCLSLVYFYSLHLLEETGHSY